MNKLVSAVIVTNSNGVTAHLKFENPRDDITMSTPNKPVIYILIEKYVNKIYGLSNE